MDWPKFRRPDYSIDLIAAWRSQFVDEIPQSHHAVAAHFLKTVEEKWPIKSRQCAALALAHANLITIQMSRPFESEDDDRELDDGFGNVWVKCDDEECGLHIVRPGKVQCERCEYVDEAAMDNP